MKSFVISGCRGCIASLDVDGHGADIFHMWMGVVEKWEVGRDGVVQGAVSRDAASWIVETRFSTSPIGVAEGAGFCRHRHEQSFPRAP